MDYTTFASGKRPFEVYVNRETVFSKIEKGRYPTKDEILKEVGKKVKATE